MGTRMHKNPLSCVGTDLGCFVLLIGAMLLFLFVSMFFGN